MAVKIALIKILCAEDAIRAETSCLKKKSMGLTETHGFGEFWSFN